MKSPVARASLVAVLVVLGAARCTNGSPDEGDAGSDAGVADAATSDATLADAGSSDAGVTFEASPAPTSSNDGSADAPFQTASIAPLGATVLTCSQTLFSASVSPRIGTEVFNFAASAGSIRQNFSGDAGPGVHAIFTSPGALDAGPVTVTATATAEQTIPTLVAAASTTVNLESFDLQAGVSAAPPVTSVVADYTIDYPHAMASNGSSVYVALPAVLAGGQTAIGVWRSGDGGKTWAPTAATGAPALGVGDVIQQEAVAVDPVDASTVYVALQVSTPSAGYEVFVMTSTDGGGSFQSVLLNAGTTPVYLYPDVVSPAAGAVVVMLSTNDLAAALAIWSDANKGAGWLDGGVTVGVPQYPYTFVDDAGAVGQIDTNAGSEQPKLFTDGKGALCMAYVVSYDSYTTREPVAQCSPDLGVTWAPPIHFTSPSTTGPTFASGTLTSASAGLHAITLTWGDSTVADGGAIFPNLHVATVTTNPTAPDPAATVTSVSTYDGTLALPAVGSPSPNGSTDVRYDANGTLWLVYQVASDSLQPLIIVDKSCDQGATWAGGTYVGAYADQATWPGLVPLSTPPAAGGMGVAAQWGSAPVDDAGAAKLGEYFYRLSP